MDGTNKLALLQALAPRLPGIVTAGALHGLRVSESSSKWDMKTALIMATIRSFLHNPKPSTVSQAQRLSIRDPGIKGPLWVSKQTIPASTGTASDVLQKLVKAIDALAEAGVPTKYTKPEIQPVEVEWTGWRSNASRTEPRPDLTENAHYKQIISDVKSDVTILYMHGGALYLMDPASHRVTVTRLAKHTGGRCMSVRYRLAPQYPFPAALLDCFVSYLSLLSPPPGSVHEPVLASKIVLAGDSAGGNLCLSLIKMILQLRHQSDGNTPTVTFHGKEVPIVMPGGLAVQSPWVDLTRCLPSNHLNCKWDYLPGPPSDMQTVHVADAVWPSRPPRADMYCEGALMLHPLVSPLMVKDWYGAPPVFICIGQESLADEGMILARRLVKSGVKTEFWQFEAMPHVFTAVLADLSGANLAVEKWANAISRMAVGVSSKSVGHWVQARSLREYKLEVAELASYLADEDVERRLRDARAKREIQQTKEDRVSSKL